MSARGADDILKTGDAPSALEPRLWLWQSLWGSGCANALIARSPLSGGYRRWAARGFDEPRHALVILAVVAHDSPLFVYEDEDVAVVEVGSGALRSGVAIGDGARDGLGGARDEGPARWVALKAPAVCSESTRRVVLGVQS